jgi:hypothetical protein
MGKLWFSALSLNFYQTISRHTLEDRRFLSLPSQQNKTHIPPIVYNFYSFILKMEAVNPSEMSLNLYFTVILIYQTLHHIHQHCYLKSDTVYN